VTRTHFSHRRLAVESLESRNLMAGNVAADLVAGSLVLQGDGQSNGVQIMPMVAAGRVQPGTFRVRGIDAGGDATTINGESEVIFRFVNDDVRVDLRGGEDRLLVNTGIQMLDSLRPTTGLLATIAGDLIVAAGNGSDLLLLGDLDVGGRVQIDAGEERDIVFVIGLTVPQSSTFVEFVLTTGGGDDGVHVADFSIEGDMLVDTGSGDFEDHVFLGRGNATSDIAVLTYGGHDIVRLFSVDCDDLTIDTGDSPDAVTLDTVSVDLLFANLGNGDQDYLIIRRTSGRQATVNGGNGSGDRFDFYENVQFDSVLESGFEVIVT